MRVAMCIPASIMSVGMIVAVGGGCGGHFSPALVLMAGWLVGWISLLIRGLGVNGKWMGYVLRIRRWCYRESGTHQVYYIVIFL